MSRQTSKQIFGNQVLTALTVTLAFGGGHALAADVCPARPESQASEPAKVRSLAHLSPQGRRMRQLDQMIDAGQYDAAEKMLLPLTRQAVDRNDTPHRAYLRLARIRAQQGRFEEARGYAATAAKSRDAKVRGQANFAISDITYREGINLARTRYDAADGLLKAGSLSEAEAAFKPLLDQPCPLPQAYKDRVKLKLANINVKDGDLEQAGTWLAAVDRASDPDIATGASNLEATLAQKKVDVAARSAFAAADAVADAGNVAGALEVDRANLVTYDNASPGVVAGGKLILADHLSLVKRFDEARTLVSGLEIDPTDTDLLARRDRMVERINGREMDAKASDLLDAADKETTSYAPRKALAVYDGMVTNPEFSTQWQQRARLRRASILRRSYDYAGAKADIDAVAAAPATPSLATNSASAASDLAEATPTQAFTGSFGGGLQVDDNAPVIVTAIPGEDGTVPYAGDQKFSDTATVLSADARYTHRLGGSYNLFTAGASLDVVDQWTLNPIDRVNLDINAGFVYFLPQRSAKIEAGLSYGRNDRGGDLLSTGVGPYVTYTQITGPYRFIAGYQGQYIDDQRVGRDGWQNTLSLQLSPASGSYGFTWGVDLMRYDPDAASLKQSTIALSGDYDWAVKTVGSWQIDGSVAGSLRTSRYDQVKTLASGSLGHQTSTRVRFEVGPTITYLGKTYIRVRYTYLGLDNNSVSYDRSDNQLNVTVSRRF